MWQYRVVDWSPAVGWASIQGPNSLEPLLNRCGVEGWELAATIPSDGGTGLRLVLKRRDDR